MATKQTNISLAKASECLELAELSRVAIEYNLRWSWKPSRILSMIKHRESCVIVARSHGGELQGFAAMEFRDVYAHLVLLATVPRFRRLGIGVELLNWLEESAVIAGLDSIKLEVRRNNQNAVQFYESAAYQITRVLPGYYQKVEDAYQMHRDLISPEEQNKRP